MTTLEEKLSQLSPERRAKIQVRADQLMAEELSLRDLRLARKLTQEKMAELLQIRQEGVSQIETNHTALFWNIVKAQIPNMEKAKQWLKDNGEMLEQTL